MKAKVMIMRFVSGLDILRCIKVRIRICTSEVFAAFTNDEASAVFLTNRQAQSPPPTAFAHTQHGQELQDIDQFLFL